MGTLNTTGFIICVELMAFCLLIIGIIFFYTIRFNKREEYKTSRLILLVNFCYGVVIFVDLINAICNWSTKEYEGMSYGINSIRFIMYISASLFWFLYCEREFHSRIFNSKWSEALVCLPATIACIFIFINPFNGWVFTISDAGYVPGTLFVMVQHTSYVYIVVAALLALIRMFRTKDPDEKKRNRSVFIYAIPLIGADVLQMATGYPFLCIGVAIALTMVFTDLVVGAYYVRERKNLLVKQRRDSLVGGLTEDYESMFIVDVDYNTIKPIRLSEIYASRFTDTSGEMNYTKRAEQAADTFVYAEDREYFLQEFATDNVWSKLEKNISYAISYRIVTLEATELYYRAKFVRLQDDDGRRFILGLRNVDDEIREELELEKLREEKAVEERTSKLQAIIEAMTQDYVMLAVVNLETGNMDKYRASDLYTERVNFKYEAIGYTNLLNKFTDAFVAEEARDEFLKEMNNERIKEQLAIKKVHSVRFMPIGLDLWYEINFADYDEETNSAVLGARNIDEIVKAEQHRQQLTRELEDAKQLQFIAGLTQDFDCVSYIDVINGFRETHYRVSSIFSDKMPGWARMPNFNTRMLMFADVFVVPEDKTKFLQEVSQDNIVKQLLDKPVFFANFRIKIEDEVRYYQIKFNGNVVDGSVVNVIAGLHDVDDEMKAELIRQEILEAAKETAEKGNEAKTTFLFNMSHDIRTPMNAIIGFTNMAMRNIDDKDKAMDALGKTQESSKVLLGLINQILDMSRIESGKVVLSRNNADMMKLCSDIWPMMEELARDKEIDLQYDISGIKNRYVVLDKVRINEIVVNLVSNAIKYTQEGGNVKTSVTQIGEVVDGKASYKLVVEDNGFGMSTEFQRHIFERFSREENSTISGIQGTGLGLALCKRLIELMNGTIDVESEEDVGSTFTVILPLETRELTDTETEELDSSNLQFDFKDKRILLVEDNDLNREIAVDILVEEGFLVEEAEDGRQAVDRVREVGENYYDFILMDIQMPIMDGYEATKYIRGICKNRHVPIIALSANAFEEDRVKSIRVGMDDHVAKPIEIDKLKKTLGRFL